MLGDALVQRLEHAGLDLLCLELLAHVVARDVTKDDQVRLNIIKVYLQQFNLDEHPLLLVVFLL